MRRKIKMAKRLDLTGRQFGSLTVIEYAGSNGRHSTFKCKCECGCSNCRHEIVVGGIYLKTGRTKTCGAWKSETGKKHKSWDGCGDMPGYCLSMVQAHAKAKINKDYQTMKMDVDEDRFFVMINRIYQHRVAVNHAKSPSTSPLIDSTKAVA